MSGINDHIFPRDGLTPEQRARRSGGRKSSRRNPSRNVLCSTCMLYRLEHSPSEWRRHNPVQGSPRA